MARRVPRPSVLHGPDTLDASCKCPVLTLPPEITSEIFMHIHCWTDIHTPRINARYPSPLVFTLVCRCLAEHRDSHAEALGFHYLYMADLWFSRAEKRSLSLKPALSNTARDWQRLGQESTNDKTSPIEFGSPVSFPRLEKLTLVDSYHLRPVIPIPSTVWKNAPSLREVSLHKNSASDFILPWEKLTTIRCVAGTTLPNCLDLLTKTLALVEFTFYYTTSASHPPTNILTLPCLRYLNLLSNGLDILSSITVPLLQTLDLAGNVYDANHRLSSLLNFLSRSQCQLAELTIPLGKSWTAPVGQPEIRLLESLASLRTLRLEHATTAGLDQFFTSLSDGSFLPRLEKLAVKGYEEDCVYDVDRLHYVTERTQEMFDRAVHGLALRWCPVDDVRSAHLESFSLESSSLFEPIQPQIIHQLRALSAEGMDLKITTGTTSWI
ncbi:hypothetical protein C8J57DRAFT_1603684 [Mycena rebaudengoi]|nr:hypothetical protein C8J57DRAFT_1603684 [Mycena rebaudengoi]